ncbi:MAG: hypothetical protein EBU84_18275, partial [Actinobacteria bacterium]|nr:hypothetical protein [Actinomycetota bacterium]
MKLRGLLSIKNRGLDAQTTFCWWGLIPPALSSGEKSKMRKWFAPHEKLALHVRDAEAGGSNPLTPTIRPLLRQGTSDFPGHAI